MMKVVYNGPRSVTHAGRRPGGRPQPYRFVPGMAVEVDPEDEAYFAEKAEKNGRWQVVEDE